MRKKKYSFAVIRKGHPMSHLAQTYRNLVNRVPEVADVFKKYADYSFPDSPGQVFYMMSELNRSIFELNEYKSEPELSTPPKVLSRPESSSSGKGTASTPRSKRKKISLGESEASSSTSETRSASPRKKTSSTVSKATDLIPTSVDQPQGSTSKGETSSFAAATRRIDSPAKSTEKVADPETCTKESGDAGRKGKVAKSPGKKLKSPLTPVQEEKDVAKPAKRPKLFDSSADISTLTSPAKKAKTSLVSSECDKMDISPTKADVISDNPNPDSKEIATSPDKGNYSKENEALFNSVPVVNDNGVEIDDPDKSSETSVPKYTASKEEVETLVDDPSRVESIQKEVEDRLKVGVSPKKTKKDLKSPTPSPRKSKRLSGSGRAQASTSSSDPDPETKFRNLVSNPNILSYLQLRFRSVSSHRHQYLFRVYNFFLGFDSDTRFLYYYSKTLALVVQENPIEDKEYFTDALNNLKGNLIRNSTDISNCLRRLIDTVKMDIPFFARGLRDIRKLNEKFDPLLSEEEDPLEIVRLLHKYESSLKNVWDRMDTRILLGNGFKSSLLRVAADFIKLTKDFTRYLVMIEVLHHSSIAASGGKKANIAWQEVKEKK